MMMNFRRIAAGSLHLLQKSATRPALFPRPSDSGVIARLRWTTRALSTTESGETAATTSPSDPNEGFDVFSSKDKLLSWVNSLQKEGKHELALHIFDYMDAKKVEFTPSELAFYIEILAKVKGLGFAKAYFKKVDPYFNNRDTHAKNWPTYATLVRLTSEELDELANHLHPLRNSYSRMAELVLPSVVSIVVRKYNEKEDRGMFGSGFFIDNTTILTCSHIVVNPQRLTDESYLNSRQEPKVVLHDGTELDGTLVQYDSLHNVAMVRVDTSGLPDGSYSPVKLGFPNRVRQGDWIGCFGAPLQLRNTITSGVVSAIRTDEELDMGDRKGQFFQMDCTTCEGSCGGPIVSLDGSVIGMTCLGIGDPTGPNQDSVAKEHGIAVSIDSVLRVLELA